MYAFPSFIIRLANYVIQMIFICYHLFFVSCVLLIVIQRLVHDIYLSVHTCTQTYINNHTYTHTHSPIQTYKHVPTSSHLAKESDVCVTMSGFTPSVAKSWIILSAYSSFSFEGFVSSNRTIKRPEKQKWKNEWISNQLDKWANEYFKNSETIKNSAND